MKRPRRSTKETRAYAAGMRAATRMLGRCQDPNCTERVCVYVEGAVKGIRRRASQILAGIEEKKQ